MPIVLTETDTNSGHICGVAFLVCADVLAYYTDKLNKEAAEGATAGVTAFTVSHGNVADLRAPFAFTSPASVPNSTAWESGNWIIRFEVSTANMNLTWNKVCVFAVLAGACTKNGTALDVASLGIGLGTTGVKSTTQSGSALTTNAGDRILASVGFKNGTSMSQSIGIKPSQNIDTPVNQGSTDDLTLRLVDFQQSINQPILTPVAVISY